jgi:formamidopyrimidine-DNA glycosylase
MTAVAECLVVRTAPCTLHLCSMPELPEVETIRRALEPQLVGARIDAVEIPDPSVAGSGGVEAISSVVGRRVDAVLRRGKHLILLLDDGRGLVLHLRMTGALLLQEPEHHARVRAVFSFSNGERLQFNDMRRLGTVRVSDDLAALMGRLGPEPLGSDFTVEMFADRLSRHRLPIKAALLDQHIVAGIGNMYADEALFRARINPLAPADELTAEQVRYLWDAIRLVLERAIINQGASINTYWLPNGKRGSAHEDFCVAHKMGAPCPRCGATIERIMVRCQLLPRSAAR